MFKLATTTVFKTYTKISKMQVLFMLGLALIASSGVVAFQSPVDIIGTQMSELMSGTRLGTAVQLTDDQVDKIVDYVTAGCYTDPELVPVALKTCVGTSANLLRQILEILESSIIGVYTSSSGPSQELLDQSVCFVRGLDLISDDGSLNYPGLDRLIASMRDSSDLRMFVREAIEDCAKMGSESQYLAICIQKALLQKCHFAGQ